MHYLNDQEEYEILNRVLIVMTATAKRLANDGTWQDCAETNEIEALRYAADLVELRDRIDKLRRTYLKEVKYRELTDAKILEIVRNGEAL